MSFAIEYRTIGININTTSTPDVKKDIKKMDGVSKEFLEKEFPNYYFRDVSLNKLNRITFFENPFKALEKVKN